MFEKFMEDAEKEAGFWNNLKNIMKAGKMKAYEMDDEDKEGNKFFVTGKKIKKYNKKSGMVYKANGEEDGHISAYEMYDSEKELEKNEKAVSKATDGNPHSDDPVADPKVAGVHSEETDQGMASAHGGKKMKKSIGEMDVDELKEMMGDVFESKLSEMLDEDDSKIEKAITIEDEDDDDEEEAKPAEDKKEVKKADGMFTEEFKNLMGKQIEDLDSGSESESSDEYKAVIKAQSDTINELKNSIGKLNTRVEKFLKTPNDVTATISGEAEAPSQEKQLDYSGVMHKAMDLVNDKKISLTDLSEIELSIQSETHSIPTRLEHHFAQSNN